MNFMDWFMLVLGISGSTSLVWALIIKRDSGTPDAEKIEQAVNMALTYGGISDADHKAWVIDQMVRILADADYRAIIANTPGWNEGIAP